MKKLIRNILTVIVALIMILSMSAASALAQNVPTEGKGSGSITISNAAKGETYTIYKLFDASVTGTKDGPIAYTGNIPKGDLEKYFSEDSAGNITETSDARRGGNGADKNDMSDGLRNALKEWADAQRTNDGTAVADGSTLVFQNVAYGYYVVKTTQGNQAITVTSTDPSAQIVDKNSTAPVSGLTKTADSKEVFIGQTINYTVSFDTANYVGAGKDAKQITAYKIYDTLPESFLSKPVVDSVTVITNIGNHLEKNSITVSNNKTPQFANKTIIVPWTDDNGTSLYKNGATLEIKYHATVADTAAIAGSGNTNSVTVTPQTGTGNDEDSSKGEATETISTYAIALKKTDEKGNALSGAVFTLPFYVKNTPAEDGEYIYGKAKTEDNTTAPAGMTDEVTTPDSGEITIKGVKSGEYSIIEKTAPAGYNRLAEPVVVNAEKLTDTSTNSVFYIGADGKKSEERTTTEVTYQNDNIAASAELVVNKSGTILPSTGGIGTTVFYLVGCAVATGAVILLIVRKRGKSNRI